MAGQYPPTFKVTAQATTASIVRFISPLQNEGKPGRNGIYWMARIRDLGGTEFTLFINPGEHAQMCAQGFQAGTQFTIVRAGSEVLVNATGGQGAATVAAPPPAAPAALPEHTVVPYIPPLPAPVVQGLAGPDVAPVFSTKQPDGLTEGFRKNADLHVTPTLVDGVHARIFARMLNGVGDEISSRARELTLKQAGLDPEVKLSATQAAALAASIQDNFATLIIAWKELGYCVTPAERARKEA